jgi:dihydrofolate reductase
MSEKQLEKRRSLAAISSASSSTSPLKHIDDLDRVVGGRPMNKPIVFVQSSKTYLDKESKSASAVVSSDLQSLQNRKEEHEDVFQHGGGLE